DDADGGEETAAGERDEEQREPHRAPGEEEDPADGRGDDARGVDRGLEADADAGEDHRGRTGPRGARDVERRLGGGAGEVAGEPEDDAGEHDADRDGGRRDDPRIPAVVEELLAHAVDRPE